MMGTHSLLVEVVCSKNLGYGDHVCAGGFHLTLVVASQYLSRPGVLSFHSALVVALRYVNRSGILPAWSLM